MAQTTFVPGTTIESSWLSDVDSVTYLDYGTTANRPSVKRKVGQMYFDTTLGKPVWWSGTQWVDSTGLVA